MDSARSIVARDGVRISYRMRDVAAGTPPRAALLLHGLASNLTRWSEFAEHTRLASRWRLIRIDLRGHGGSPTRGAIGIANWCDDLEDVLAQEGGAPALLIGHSLGAQVALQFAARAPDRCAGVVLIDPVFRQALQGRWRLLATFGPLLHAAAVAVRGLNALGLRRGELPALDLRALDEEARIALRSPQGSADFVRRYSSTRADLRTFRTAHYLQELVELFRPVPAPETVRVPMLVLLSAGGTFAAPAASAAIARRYRNTGIVTIDCQHWPLTERPQEVRGAIERWCDAL